MLFFSSKEFYFSRVWMMLFQSRNRDAFLFKKTRRYTLKYLTLRFNLVIEMLFFSRMDSIPAKTHLIPSFNLVIEMLFFSRLVSFHVAGVVSFAKFQSRNRDAFLFKRAVCCQAERVGMFQSRNRDAFLFKQSFIGLCQDDAAMFQSRNRDAFLFKFYRPKLTTHQIL